LDESRYRNCKDVVQHLKMRFGNKHLEQVYEAQLASRSQETLQQYEADIARLVYLAYPTASQDIRER